MKNDTGSLFRWITEVLLPRQKVPASRDSTLAVPGSAGRRDLGACPVCRGRRLTSQGKRGLREEKEKSAGKGRCIEKFK